MYVLENNRLKVEIAEPGGVYSGSRFDWTGLITQVTLDKTVTYCVPERLEAGVGTGGIGLSNEFGIDAPIGYDAVRTGEQFPKIGVGLLTKAEETAYDFFYDYNVAPADVKVNNKDQTATFTTTAESPSGYGYHLVKEIALDNNHLVISYILTNTGKIAFKTNEYSHNFLGINSHTIDEEYKLILPNMRGLDVKIGNIKVSNKQLTWPVVPDGDFYAHIDMDENRVGYNWDLYHKTARAGVREQSVFKPAKMALWGRDHVISPEVFIDITLAPGEIKNWQRCYQFYQQKSQ
ncbi:hypothetical protein [Amphibacillus cookii]|uniref:hypothetical protein n=1 Tax=Amphibacillus cookii TaxID=767787 RepID=UPI00195A5DF3|nr:hypothetical protein [Amphibacillus cookii]MBM7540755.1 hypothetical protein [Amphibacillus cookii]